MQLERHPARDPIPRQHRRSYSFAVLQISPKRNFAEVSYGRGLDEPPCQGRGVAERSVAILKRGVPSVLPIQIACAPKRASFGASMMSGAAHPAGAVSDV